MLMALLGSLAAVQSNILVTSHNAHGKLAVSVTSLLRSDLCLVAIIFGMEMLHVAFIVILCCSSWALLIFLSVEATG